MPEEGYLEFKKITRTMLLTLSREVRILSQKGHCENLKMLTGRHQTHFQMHGSVLIIVIITTLHACRILILAKKKRKININSRHLHNAELLTLSLCAPKEPAATIRIRLIAVCEPRSLA
jgi:hypothetical protein